jgi:hypothetical protein
MTRREILLSPLASVAPQNLAERLAGVYGQTLTDCVYTQTFAPLGRWRMGQTRAVEALLEPFLDGRVNSLAKPTASHYSGHMIFAQLDRDPRAKALFERTAQMAAGNPLDNQMSDSVFMVCPLLAMADMADRAVAHFEKMRALCERADGLWRHSPLADVAWGRGNAFPLLGLAMTLRAAPVKKELRAPFESLGAALLRHQQPDGMWRQVVDERRAWPEYSCTAMIAAALHIGVIHRWLPEGGFSRAIEKAWQAVERRTRVDGVVEGVCESTGKMPDLDAYLNRKSITGLDPRGGGMALFAATELMVKAPPRE